MTGLRNILIAALATLMAVFWVLSCSDAYHYSGGSDAPGTGGSDTDSAGSNNDSESPFTDDDGETNLGLELPDESTMGPETEKEYEPVLENSDGVDTTDDGWLVLKKGLKGDLNNLWVSNAAEGTVSNVDTELIKEVGRYHSGLAPDPNPDPSRTSVDLAGDVFVGNRGDGSVTKISGSTDRCVDRNGNGTIETSTGPGDIYPRAGAGDPNGVLAGQSTDECVLWTKALANEGIGCDGPRAVAATWETGDNFEFNGHVWIGCRDSNTIFKLNGNTGDVLVSYGPFDGLSGKENVSPYGFVLDKAELNRVWISGKGGDGTPAVYWMDTRNGVVKMAVDGADFSPLPYGIALDDNSHVWITTDKVGEVWRYKPDEQLWEGLVVGDVKFKGVAVDADGFVWPIVNSDVAAVYAIDPATFPAAGSASSAYTLADDINTPEKGGGVAIDFSGHVWGVSGKGCTEGEKTGCASRLVVDRSGSLPVISGVADNVQVGEGTYSYSDMIGYSLRNFTTKEGWYRQIFDVCNNKSTKWKQIAFESRTPAGTRFIIRARTADQKADLLNATWYTVVQVPSDVSPVDLPANLPEGHFIELEVRMYTQTNGVSPEVGQIGFTYECTYDIVLV